MIPTYKFSKHESHTEEVGQAGRIASWVPMPNCAREFIDSMAVVEWTSLTSMEAIEWQRCQASILTENRVLLLRSSLWFVFYHTKCTFLKLYGSCCHFSFVNNQCERRNCAILNVSQALVSNWSWMGVNCIINVKTRSLLKDGVLQCTTVVSWLVTLSNFCSAVLNTIYILYCSFIGNTQLMLLIWDFDAGHVLSHWLRIQLQCDRFWQ